MFNIGYLCFMYSSHLMRCRQSDYGQLPSACSLLLQMRVLLRTFNKFCCNICDMKCKTNGGNSSNLRKHLFKIKIFPKVEETHFSSASDLQGLDNETETPGF
ncbi:hypothetical protein CHARACLAT_030976 [Characodon lateralis]|uniref:BED-type domain-containing protein n=1 Tax=Characodon lateralis TaxID=208331 RepID=A0ABU7E873_9TELE|nr:hypothetical protein [Characodon lateralis]